jgi:sigma-E factor negative regulatory protein RseA
MNEQISALIDGEMSAEDAAHIIAAIETSAVAAGAWSQYHLIGDAMRGTGALSPDFKQNLMLELELEPTVLSPKPLLDQATEVLAHSQSRLPAVWSIAASFAAVMVVGWIALQQQTHTDNVMAATTVAQNAPADAGIAAEYLLAHQATAPSGSAYYIQSVSYSE